MHTNSCIQLSQRALTGNRVSMRIVVDLWEINLKVYDKIIKMEIGNTLFYQGHIRDNLTKFDERKDNYIGNRLDFITHFLEPIQKKIDHIKERIKHYEHMKDTQKQVIENEPDVLKLKAQIEEYLQTNQYFEQKLDEFDQMNIILGSENKKLRNQINAIKGKYIKSHKGQTRRLDSVLEAEELIQHKSTKLPKIRRPQKYYIFHQHTRKTNHSLYTSIQPSMGNLDNSIITENPEELSSKRIREMIAQFDRTETLFRECFQKKKMTVQKSVSQLQSKLITNKESFLKACQVIGEKEGSLSFQEFSELSSDEIITLFISFGWLNRKIYNEFTRKRKAITTILSKLPEA